MVNMPWKLSIALHASFVWAALPIVDFDRMGKVGLAGAFAGLDLFNSSSPTFDPSSSTLFSRQQDGSLSRIAVTNAQGRILAGCAIGDVFYFGGSFSSVSDVQAQNVASYNSASNTISALGSGGPNGQVDVVYCDRDKVWFGGKFSSPGSAVAIWDTKSSAWSPPPFKGVQGAGASVLSITSDQSSLFFAGSFLVPFGSSVAINGTNNPNVPFSAGATPYSSSLVPVPLSNVEVEGSPSTSEPGFSDIKAILCPAGNDGPGNTWFARDGATALVTIRTFTSLMASGIRLGNTFLGNHATTGFSVTTIPDNEVRTLRYVDPTTGQNQTCSDPCPLLTDPSILYQDFLFDSALSITGVQIKLSQWNGQAPGLHIVQLLSSGAFASAIDGDNGPSCFAPQASRASHTGQWSAKVANTNIAGTTQTVLVSTVNVGTSSSSKPSFTWMPYVSASGNYDLNLLVPGCSAFQDCALRTSVKVTVFPGNGLPPTITEVDQRTEENSVSRIYSGPIVPTTPDFVATITMTLADDPAGNGQNGRYELVADRVQLVLTSANVTSSGTPSNGTIGGPGSQVSFGFLEWSKSSNEQVDATTALPNSTLTEADQAGIQIARGLGSNLSVNTNISTVVHHPSGTKYLAGSFSLSSGVANIVAFKDGNLAALPDNGLNGPVSSMVLVGEKLFVGGSFRDTSSGSQQGKLRGIALYDIAQNTWSPLQAGVDGAVSNLGHVDGIVQVAGNFTRIIPSDGSSTGGVRASGLAAWRVDTGAWVNPGGFIVGNIHMIANGTDSEQFVAGSIVASKKYGATGMVLLKNGDKNGPVIEPLSAQLDSSVGSAAPTAPATTSRRKRHLNSWVGRFTVPRLFSRQTTSQPSNVLPVLPAPAPAVLAGAFWTNTSSSSSVAILGGNFTFAGSQAVALYDTDSEKISPLAGNQVNGVVRALLVLNDRLFIGGQFTLEGANVNGLGVYNLASGQWDNTNLQALQPASGSTVVVRAITKSEADPESIIVAGSFAQAGGLSCTAICKLNTRSMQWNALGDGIQGEVSSVAYGGDNQNILVAAGSITLGGANANVARYSIANNTWSAVGDGSQLPGIVTAIEVNGGNSSSIFAAGRSIDGSSPFLYFWDGATWSAQQTTLQGNTTVTQLAMVPLQNTHKAGGVIQRDRMLMISGALVDSSFGSASSVLYDGQTFIPYIVSTSQDGTPGFVSSIFRSFSIFSFNQRRFLATGIVILISIAIAAGVVFLLALIGIIWALLSRRDEKATAMGDADDDDDSAHHRPSSLLEHINAATRSTIIGASTSPFSHYNSDKEEEKIQEPSSSHADQDPFVSETFQRAETPSDAAGHVLADESSRVAHVRYSFDGSGEGELPLDAGTEVEILDDKDQAWWYARDPRTGREGVVPAAYLY